MRITTLALLAGTAMLASACGAGPGSAEWCKGVIQGTIKASAEELQANSEKCEAVMVKELQDAIGGMKLPGQ